MWFCFAPFCYVSLMLETGREGRAVQKLRAPKMAHCNTLFRGAEGSWRHSGAHGTCVHYFLWQLGFQKCAKLTRGKDRVQEVGTKSSLNRISCSLFSMSFVWYHTACRCIIHVQHACAYEYARARVRTYTAYSPHFCCHGVPNWCPCNPLDAQVASWLLCS